MADQGAKAAHPEGVSELSVDYPFQTIQQQFTQHMRDPDSNPGPSNIESRRLKIYSDLLYNNVESFLSNSFPVLREMFEDENWHEMVRDYFKNHTARTPLFRSSLPV